VPTDGQRPYERGPDATQRATRSALSRVAGASTIVLVEGISDQIAIDIVAGRLGRDFEDERVVVVPIGGAQAAPRVVETLPADVRIVGLCDEAEIDFFTRCLDPDDVFVCRPDLEAELIASFSPDALEAVVDAEGELRAFRTLQKQANWKGRPFDAQMHRWLRSSAERGMRYASILPTEAGRDAMPAPLVQLVHAI